MFVNTTETNVAVYTRPLPDGNTPLVHSTNTNMIRNTPYTCPQTADNTQTNQPNLPGRQNNEHHMHAQHTASVTEIQSLLCIGQWKAAAVTTTTPRGKCATTKRHALRCLREALLPGLLPFCVAAPFPLLLLLPAPTPCCCCCCPLLLTALTCILPLAFSRLKPAYTHRNATSTMGGRGMWLPCCVVKQGKKGHRGTNRHKVCVECCRRR